MLYHRSSCSVANIHCKSCLKTKRIFKNNNLTTKTIPVTSYNSKQFSQFTYYVPKSLIRPIRYVKCSPQMSANSKIRPTTSSLSYPTKIVGVLQDLKDDIVNESGQNQSIGDYLHHTTSTAPRTGLKEIYVESNGRFTKSVKESNEQDISGGTIRYIQSIDPGDDFYNTPLDMAIFVQKMWNGFSKVLFGLLAGIAVYDLILLHFLSDITRNWAIIENFLNVYSQISFLITKTYHIMLTICIVTLFDWFDLAHMNWQHLSDTIHFRKIWIVTIVYIIALIASLYNFSTDDMMFLYNYIKEDLKNSENLDYTLYLWLIAKKIKCWCLILGWILLVTTNNEDLFLIHLMAMKKYDYEEEINQVYENVNAIS